MQDLSDEQLVRLAVASKLAESDAALNELFSRYQKRVALWCLRVSGDRDCVRETPRKRSEKVSA